MSGERQRVTRQPGKQLSKQQRDNQQAHQVRDRIPRKIKACPDCNNVMMIKHRYWHECPDCGGELWGQTWFPGRKGFEDLSRITLIPDEWKGKGSKGKSGRSGRRRKKQKPVRRPMPWLDNY
ncbi:MAG: hypothetical protein FH749_06870 [Firmicutes bacterium]|nr:hypothetical protein [Bacillota bacterium]